MPVIPNVQITLKFNNDGTLSGFGGCNNYNGGYTLTGQTTEFGKTISIGPLASTKMYCADTADLNQNISQISRTPRPTLSRITRCYSEALV